MELTKDDLSAVTKAFTALDRLAKVVPEQVSGVEIRLVIDSETIVIGYGEAGEPAILRVIEPEPENGWNFMQPVVNLYAAGGVIPEAPSHPL